MTLYEEDNAGFDRPRPSALPFAVVSLCLIVLSAQFTTLALSLADALFAWAGGWSGDLWLYSPFADSFRHGLYSSPPISESYRLFPPLMAALSLGVAVLLVYFWPAQRALFSSLSIQAFALSLLTFGTIALAFQPENFAELERRFAIKGIIWSVLSLLIALWLVMALERKTVELMTNVFSLEARRHRLWWWALRLLPGFGLLAFVCFLNGYRAGTWAALSTLAVTLVDNLTRVPRQRFQALQNPFLRGAAAMLPIITSAAIAASVYFFGLQPVGRPPAVLTLGQNSTIKMEPLAEARKNKYLGGGALKKLPGDPEGPVIDIRWADPNKAGGK